MAFPTEFALATARRAGVLSGIGRLSAGATRILAYHGVIEGPCEGVNYDAFHVPLDRFEAQMRHLARSCHVLPLEEIPGRGRPGGRPRVALTFDDGYANNHALAAPILDRLGFPATFFITTGFLDGSCRPWWFALRRHLLAHPEVGFPPGAPPPQDRSPSGRLAAWERALRRTTETHRVYLMDRMGVTPEPPDDHDRFMAWDDVRALARAGHEIGAHTVAHPSLSREDADRRRRELAEPRDRIRRETGGDATALAYPYGSAAHVSDMVRRDAEAAGYTLAVTTVEGLVGRGADPLSLPRLNVTGRHHGARFEALVSGARLLRR